MAICKHGTTSMFCGWCEDQATLREVEAEVRSLKGQRGTLRVLLQEARGVLGTIEPEDTHEAGLLAQLVADIDKALAPCEPPNRWRCGACPTAMTR